MIDRSINILKDSFSDECRVGRVIGTRSSEGCERLGIDIEKAISIDNGALRIAPLIEPGFGRAGLSYGPFSSKPGLSFAVFILNGHNTSQAEYLSDSFIQRLKRWFIASESDPPFERLKRWTGSKRIQRTFKQFLWWWRIANRKKTIPKLDENLSVGWFSRSISADPRQEGSSFIMHALGAENGELWAGGPRSERTRAIRGVQNLPLYLVGIMRENGTIYYASSLEGSNGFSGYPRLRAIALDRCPPDKEVFLGIHQSVLGQIGFRLDTRIYGVRVVHMDDYTQWCSGAHAADKLLGEGILLASEAEVGGKWAKITGDLVRSQAGAKGCGLECMAVLDPKAHSGLIHAVVNHGEDSGNNSVGLIWRCKDGANFWKIELNRSTCTIICTINGVGEVLATMNHVKLEGDQSQRLQVLDDGNHIMGYLDGLPIADKWICDKRLFSETRLGISVAGSENHSPVVREFEAHPKYIDIPTALDMGSPWMRKGKQMEAADHFLGKCEPLEGRITSAGRVPDGIV